MVFLQDQSYPDNKRRILNVTKNGTFKSKGVAGADQIILHFFIFFVYLHLEWPILLPDFFESLEIQEYCSLDYQFFSISLEWHRPHD